MKCFVAGGGGYLGLPLCAELLKRGHEVTAFDMFFFKRFPHYGCRQVVGDIRSVSESDLKGHDAVIDLAGLSNDAAGDLDPQLTIDINVNGAKRLATVAKLCGIKRYIYSSSASVYGNNANHFLTEKDECKPLTTYAESKVRMEDFLRSISDRSFSPIILRNGTVYGVSPRMRFDLVVNAMTRSAWSTRSITIDGDGRQWRPFVHVSDVVGVFADRLNWDGPFTENVVASNFTINDIAGDVAASFPHRIKAKRNKDANDKRSYHVKPTLLVCKGISTGINEVKTALDTYLIDPNDPSAWTVKWYQSLSDLKVMEAA